jgi:hypothetical protein
MPQDFVENQKREQRKQTEKKENTLDSRCCGGNSPSFIPARLLLGLSVVVVFR